MAKMTVDGTTTLAQLQKFTADAGDGSKLRAKYDKKTDSYTLYTSSKGNGTGLKERLFGTVSTRRANAQSAISKIFFNTPRVDAFGGKLSGLNVAFSNVQSGLPHTGDIRGRDLKEAVSSAQLAFAQALLPPGVDVDANGFVRGETTITHKNVVGQGPVAVRTAIQDSVDERVGGTSKKGFKTIDGKEIHTEFLDDALRMNFSIDGKKTNTHKVSSTEGRATGEKDVTDTLSTFAGSANALKVLSSACHQGLFNNFVSTLNKGDGEAIKFGMPHKGAGDNTCTFTDSHGTTTNVGVPSQFAGVDVGLSKYPNGDFKMTVDWDTYFSRVIDSSNTSHDLDSANPQNVMKMNTTCEIRISKTEADQGRFQFTFEQNPTATFEGKIG